MSRTGGVAAAAVALALLGGAAGASAGRQAAPTTLPAPSPGEPGWQRRYELALEARIGRSGGDGRRVRLEGEWVETVAATRGGETDLACQVVGARLSSAGGEAPPAAVDALRRRLERTFWVTTRSDGALVRVHFPRDVDPADRNLLQMIATEAQLVTPPGAGAAWTAVERDGAGLYLAAYRRDGAGRLAKKKVRYLEADGVAGEGPGAVDVDVVADERHLEIDGRGALVALAASSRFRVGASGPGGERLDVEVAVRLANARDGAAPELAASLERAGSGVESSPVRTHRTSPEEARTQRDRGLIEGRTAEALLAEAEGGSADPALIDRLAALFRLHADAIPGGAALARRPTGPRVVVDALGTAGTPAAVDALGELLRDPAAPERARLEAAAALARVPRPEAGALRLPLALLDEPSAPLRHAAQLAAGALARAGRQAHPDEATAVERDLAARYAAARDPEERVSLLGALGNAAGPVATEAMARALGDDSAVVRAAAARGLRLATGPEVDGLLAGAMASDGDPGVRLAAIFAAGFRSVDPFVDALCAAAVGDSAEQVRRGAVGLLSRHLDASPRVRLALAQVAERDPKDGVRRLARDALGGPGR